MEGDLGEEALGGLECILGFVLLCVSVAFSLEFLSVSSSACLRFLAGALRRGRYALFVLTGAKHRVRSKHHGRALQATHYGERAREQSLAKDPASAERATMLWTHTASRALLRCSTRVARSFLIQKREALPRAS